MLGENDVPFRKVVNSLKRVLDESGRNCLLESSKYSEEICYGKREGKLPNWKCRQLLTVILCYNYSSGKALLLWISKKVVSSSDIYLINRNLLYEFILQDPQLRWWLRQRCSASAAPYPQTLSPTWIYKHSTLWRFFWYFIHVITRHISTYQTSVGVQT